MAKLQKATFAGGCFWCLDPAFRAAAGVIESVVGYTGGTTKNPTYEQVCSDKTGHYEALQVTFDSEKISYPELVDIFWRQIDPTDAGGQFADRGSSYKTAIFYHSAEQQKIAETSKVQLEKTGIYPAPIVTEILPASEFYPAEDYHQAYFMKEPEHYKLYRYGSGRQPYLDQMWGSKTK